MAQTYTLEEAAQKLGIPAEELKRRLRDEWKNVRSFRDGATLRFRAADIDELARTLGRGSDPDLQLPDAPSDELVLPLDVEESGTQETPAAAKGAARAGAPDEDVLVLLPEEGSSSKSGSGRSKPAAKPASDSDVRLEKGARPAGRDEAAAIPTEEIEIELPASGSGRLSGSGSSGKKAGSSSGRLTGKGPKSSGRLSKANPPPEDDSSEFELSLDVDSDEFELSLHNDESEEVSLGELPASRGPRSGDSGINLANPADSGVSLEKKEPEAGSDEDIEFELSLDAGEASNRLGSKSGKKLDDSDSEFELALDDSGDAPSLEASDLAIEEEPQKDIFETDFEIPALDDESASEAVALDEADTDLESSDFDLAVDESDVSIDEESASEAVEIDEDEAPAARKKPTKARKRPAAEEVEVSEEDEAVVEEEAEVSYDEVDETESASAALRGVSRARDEEEEEEEGAPAAVAAAAPWPGWVAIPLLLGTFVLFLGGVMGYELLRGMWGYHQPDKPSMLVVDNLAKMFDVQPKE